MSPGEDQKSRDCLDAGQISLIEHPVIFVMGPTASGKSKFALELAMKFGGCVVNFDSIQFYKDLEIGSSAPTEQEKKQAPHFLFSYVSAPAEMTAGQFLRDFSEIYPRIQKTIPIHQPVIFVGGTGFYQQALEHGMYAVPEISEELKKQVLSEMQAPGGPEKLFQELNEFDPEHSLHINDHYRVGRAIEVKRAFGASMSKLRSQNLKQPIQIRNKIKIGIDKERSILERDIASRTQMMIENGLIEETKRVLEVIQSPWSPLDSVGYKETVQYLRGEISIQQLPEFINISTRQLVKKQRTWFKRDDSLLWSTLLPVESLVEQFLLKARQR